VYQDLDALKEAVRFGNPRLTDFEASCFDGRYITGDITPDYLSSLAKARDRSRGEAEPEAAEDATA
jgi:amidophosphoribosyltransferase